MNKCDFDNILNLLISYVTVLQAIVNKVGILSVCAKTKCAFLDCSLQC